MTSKVPRHALLQLRRARFLQGSHQLEDAPGKRAEYASVVVYNAHRIELRAFEDTSLALFEESWRANCYGAFVVARRALPGMLQQGSGTLMFSGATGSRRGGARAAAFSSSKFALRGL
ncbi:MAG: SDR family NAD(P)-dependent oxidoreductase, partial [Myxococcales bacterium]